MYKNRRILTIIFVAVCLFTMSAFAVCILTSCSSDNASHLTNTANETKTETAHDESDTETFDEDSEVFFEDLNDEGAPSLEELTEEIPDYDGASYAWINEDRPYFDEEKLPDEPFEYYAPLDNKGRCGMCVACIGEELMPTEKRQSIGMVKPSGWQTVKYDDVDGGYLYNRCHLIAHMLTGENANERNLITGTRNMNISGMLPREELVANYINKTGNHVFYRVTPVFEEENLVATGVIMEAKSVEDNGDGLQFNVFVYNEQPGIKINHANGKSKEIDGTSNCQTDSEHYDAQSSGNIGNNQAGDNQACDYIANTNTGKFHYKWCTSVKRMSEKNKYSYRGERQKLINMGFEPCANCHP